MGLEEGAEVETMTTTGSGDATATASWVGGPSVGVEGAGNFGGSGTVMVGGVTEAEVVFGSSLTAEMDEGGIADAVASAEDAFLIEFLLMQGNAEPEGLAPPVADNSPTSSTLYFADALAQPDTFFAEEFLF